MASHFNEIKKPFISPVQVNTTITLPSLNDVIILNSQYAFVMSYYEITYPDNTTKDKVYGEIISGTTPIEEFIFSQSGIYTIHYYTRTDKLVGISDAKDNNFYYRIAVAQNQYPLKPQTIKEVIERQLELVEPLVVKRNNDNTATYVKLPRFKFEYKHPEDTEDGKAERALFNQTAPEFTFTRMTLREVLQEIGK
ncbi:MAG: hypothetical protein HFE28_03955, partial [Clostridia bacterium]|nr:hypothetical protein [Clostridia bacterium]